MHQRYANKGYKFNLVPRALFPGFGEKRPGDEVATSLVLIQKKKDDSPQKPGADAALSCQMKSM